MSVDKKKKNISGSINSPGSSGLSKSQCIWETIKDKNIDVFSIVKKVSDYFEFVDIDPKKCYLLGKASAALPALETSIGDNYSCNLDSKYVVVEEVVKLP